MLRKKGQELGIVGLVSLILVFLAYWTLRGGRWYGPAVLAMTLVPLFGARLGKLELKRLLPDVVFGAVDTGLLTLASIIGASTFGVIGAIVGGVVGDAITDAVAGFFEGGISEWLRSKGIDESRTALGSACGKMTGCLAGSGVVLTIAGLIGMAILE